MSDCMVVWTRLINNFRLAAAANTPLVGAREHLKGYGFTMEGSENNPVMFELMSELPWMVGSLPSADSIATFRQQWLNAYVRARYGTDDATLQQVWQPSGNSIYNCPAGNNQQGPHESIFDGRPSLNNFQVKSLVEDAQLLRSG